MLVKAHFRLLILIMVATIRVLINRSHTYERLPRACRKSFAKQQMVHTLGTCVPQPFGLCATQWKNLPMGVCLRVVRACPKAKVDRWATNSWPNLKMGQRDIRWLHITGARAVIRWGIRKGLEAWLAKILACKPRMLVATAFANKLARTVWALTTKKEDYRITPLAA